MIDYTTKRDKFVEDSLKEMIGIIITSEMREVMTSISHKEDFINFLNDKDMTVSEFKEYETYYEERRCLEDKLRMLVSENVDILS